MAEIDRKRIASAALTVADARGASGFTMRAVADALGVTPMALYHHVTDKAALVGLVVEAVINEHPFPSPTGSWQDDLWELARWNRRCAQAHPAASHLQRVYQVLTPGMLPVTERWMGIWQQSGLPLHEALLAAAASSLAVHGYIESESRFRGMDRPDDGVFDRLPNARLLFNAEYDPETAFELLVRSLVAGLHARLAPGSEKPRPEPSA